MFVTLCCVIRVQDGGTALYYASRNGYGEVVRVLLAANATVNIQNEVCIFIIYLLSKIYFLETFIIHL